MCGERKVCVTPGFHRINVIAALPEFLVKNSCKAVMWEMLEGTYVECFFVFDTGTYGVTKKESWREQHYVVLFLP